MTVDPKDIYEYLVAKDVPKNHALGILANMKAESGFDAGVQEKHPIAGRGGYGLCQWTGPRRRALERFAANAHRNLWDWEMQCDYLLSEPDTDHYLDHHFRDPESATAWFLAHWERPAHLNTHARLRYLGQIEHQIGVA